MDGWLAGWLLSTWFLGIHKRRGFQTCMQIPCVGSQEGWCPSNFFSMYCFFSKKYEKLIFCKYDFWGSTNCPNFKLCTWRAYGGWEVTAHLICFFVFFTNNTQNFILIHMYCQLYNPAAVLRAPVIAVTLFVNFLSLFWLFATHLCFRKMKSISTKSVAYCMEVNIKK